MRGIIQPQDVPWSIQLILMSIRGDGLSGQYCFTIQSFKPPFYHYDLVIVNRISPFSPRGESVSASHMKVSAL